MKSLIFSTTAVLAIILAFAMLPPERAEAEQPLATVNVGTARAFIPLDSKGRISRVETIEGRAYHVYGLMQGVENTAVRIQTAKNGVKYLCGGMPDNCAQLAT